MQIETSISGIAWYFALAIERKHIHKGKTCTTVTRRISNVTPGEMIDQVYEL